MIFGTSDPRNISTSEYRVGPIGHGEVAGQGLQTLRQNMIRISGSTKLSYPRKYSKKMILLDG